MKEVTRNFLLVLFHLVVCCSLHTIRHETDENQLFKQYKSNISTRLLFEQTTPPLVGIDNSGDDFNNEATNHDSDDVNSDPGDKVHDIEDINEKAEKEVGGVIKDEDAPGSHVDMEDIMFQECEEEKLFGTGGNMPNPKCANILKKAHQKDAITTRWKLWQMPVSYQIDYTLGDTARRAIQEAIMEYQLKTCITFKNQKTRSYLWFFKGKGCWSAIGRHGGRQKISLSEGCEYKGTAVHEMMHALGFYHEQSRTDRDRYVDIIWPNIVQKPSNLSYNFRKLVSGVTTYGFPYDYESVMHYDKTAFGKEISQPNLGWIRQQTIRPKPDSNVQLGQCPSCGMSKIDALQLNERYCNGKLRNVKRSILRRKIQNWMVIFNQQTNFEFSRELKTHLSAIYFRHYFTVSSFIPFRGSRKSKRRQSEARGRCITIKNYFGRSVVVCYTKKYKKFPSKRLADKITRATLGVIKKKGCCARYWMRRALAKARSFGYKIAMVHVIRFGNDLHTSWTGDQTRFVNYQCATGVYASLLLMFGTSP